MDKFIRILRAVLLSFIIFWFVVWISIRAQLSKESGNNGRFNSFITQLHGTPGQLKNFLVSKESLSRLAIKIDSVKGVVKIGEATNLDDLNDSIYLLHHTNIDGNLTIQGTEPTAI